MYILLDPDLWQMFFNSHFGHLGNVAYVTGALISPDVTDCTRKLRLSVAKDNGALLYALANKRYIAKMLFYEDIRKDGVSDDTGDDHDIDTAPYPLKTSIMHVRQWCFARR